jgi:hypothetical protein
MEANAWNPTRSLRQEDHEASLGYIESVISKTKTKKVKKYTFTVCVTLLGQITRNELLFFTDLST